MSASATAVTIEFSVDRYLWAHRRKPRGFRLWYFRLPDGSTFCFSGTYSEAKRAAARAAAARLEAGSAAILVCA